VVSAVEADATYDVRLRRRMMYFRWSSAVRWWIFFFFFFFLRRTSSTIAICTYEVTWSVQLLLWRG
jgi:hypothetical protein